MSCVPVPADTPLPTATPCHTENSSQTSAGKLQAMFPQLRHLLLQEQTKPSGSHTKLQLHTNTLGCAPVCKVGSDPIAVLRNMGGQHHDGWQQGRLINKGVFSNTFESKQADSQNCVMKNTDILIKKKCQPKQLLAQENLKSLLSTIVWMFVNKRAVARSLPRALSALQIVQEIMCWFSPLGLLALERQNPAQQLDARTRHGNIITIDWYQLLISCFSTQHTDPAMV